MHAEQRARTRDLLKSKGVAAALFASRASVTWLTGFAPAPQVGVSFAAGGPPLVWYADGHFTLLVMESQVADAAGFAAEPDGAVVAYEGASIDTSLRGPINLADLLAEVVAAAGVRAGKVGVEERDLPIALWHALRDALPDRVALIAADGWLAPLRTVKTAEELVRLMDNFALAGIGQAAARRATRVGQREIDVWSEAHAAIQRAAGERVPLGNDCVVGYRQNNVGGWPLNYPIRPHDSLIVDLSTIRYGYWSDGAATYYGGWPTERQAAMHRTVARALELGISMIRPGAVAGEIDRAMRRFIADAGYPVYGHHSGHGVGVTSHEAPRIVPYSVEIIEADMVLMLEPGIYVPGETSVRLEDAVLVTPTGAKRLTHHDKSLPIDSFR
ncbi:MAG: Xaa-Pro peptidase family protein [Anaerolineae bacterium]